MNRNASKSFRPRLDRGGPRPDTSDSRANWLFGCLFSSAVLTIGLTEYRPVLGGIGNLSDSLFLASFVVWIIKSFPTMDGGVIERGLQVVRELEPLFWGGIALSIGGVIASLGSDQAFLSWRITAKYFVTFCVWLPWVTFVLGRYVVLRGTHHLYIIGLGLVAVATLSDVIIGTRFGLWLQSNPPEGALQDLLHLRYGGPTGHPTSLGYVAAIGLILSLPFVTGQGRRTRSLFGIVCLLLFGGALLVSGSRASLVGIAAGCVALAFLGPRGGVRRLLVTAAACLSVLAVVSRIDALKTIMPVDPLERLHESLQPRRDFDADWDRRRDLKSAEVLLSHDPITGYGMENVGTSPNQPIGFNLHNTVLQSWVAGGILAGLGTVGLYLAVFIMGWRALRDGDSITLSLFAACVAFVMMDMVHPHLYMRFKWFVAALLIATLRKFGSPSKRAAVTPSAT